MLLNLKRPLDSSKQCIHGRCSTSVCSFQDHKPVGEGDTGPNTGGMGAYSPAPVVTPEMERLILDRVVHPTASAMVAAGAPFRGVLFAGLMIKDGQPRLLEHNVRFGDPECQALVMRMEGDLLEPLLENARAPVGSGAGLARGTLRWSNDVALTVVLASKGYPGSYRKGSVIGGLENVKGAKVFHAGTAWNDKGQIIATGGRVLGITALADTVLAAQQRAYAAVD